jgi:hypothetical protein
MYEQSALGCVRFHQVVGDHRPARHLQLGRSPAVQRGRLAVPEGPGHVRGPVAAGVHFMNLRIGRKFLEIFKNSRASYFNSTTLSDIPVIIVEFWIF